MKRKQDALGKRWCCCSRFNIRCKCHWSNFYYHNRTLLRLSNMHIVIICTASMDIYHLIATAPFKQECAMYLQQPRAHRYATYNQSFLSLSPKDLGIFSYTNSQTLKLGIASSPSCDSWRKLSFVIHTDGSTESKDQWFESAHKKCIILTALAELVPLRSHSSRMK